MIPLALMRHSAMSLMVSANADQDMVAGSVTNVKQTRGVTQMLNAILASVILREQQQCSATKTTGAVFVCLALVGITVMNVQEDTLESFHTAENVASALITGTEFWMS